MPGTGSELDHNNSQTSEGKGKITCHLVSLPKVILHRIDENTIASYKKPSSSLKKPVKRLTHKPSKLSPGKSPPSKNSEKNNLKTPKSRLKKENNFAFKSAKLQKKIVGGKLEGLSKALTKVSPKNLIKLQSSPVKNMLNKTMLQKKSKIAIPPPKKSKSISLKSAKPIPPKQKSITSLKGQKKSSTAKPKIHPPPARRTSDSGDEFLYEELIEQIENSESKRNEVLMSMERTASITLKPNAGNKPPTVVKGGIIKKTKLPADLKPVSTPNNLNSLKDTKDVSSPKATGKSTSTRKNIKPPRKSLSPIPAKKASPWPIAISTPFIDPSTTNQKINKKPGPKSKTALTAGKITPKLSQKGSKPSVPPVPSSNFPRSIHLDDKPISFNTGKPKIGPKKTATVIPQLKSQDNDDNLSDEYTEEERLENIDPDPVESTKLTHAPKKDVKPGTPNIGKEMPPKKPAPPSYDNSQDDEDPHLDLLRILTDESEEPIHVQPPAQQSIKKSTNIPSPVKYTDSKMDISHNENANNDDSIVSSLVKINETVNDDVEPPPRTIYDLMNEISLQYPSWNLHILPESNAFCIAQVTKGRLGLPTLKKCIELDPNDYNAKVYIHQYHIKRFDGVYDSEESIVALIEEINSIKA